MSEKQTPMMEQYWEFRNSIPKDTVLLFRLGDFYEMFYDDAVECASILGITLTKRSNYPMAGIPYHAAPQYVPKLLAAGKKIAICEQDEVAQAGKLVRRSINRILTPGTILEENQLESKTSSYMLAFNIAKDHTTQASWMDLSTGEFYCANFKTPENFLSALNAINPKEILIPNDAAESWKRDEKLYTWHAIFRNLADLKSVTRLADYRFQPEYGENLVLQALKVYSLEGFGIERLDKLLGPAGALVFYATENLRQTPKNLRSIKKIEMQNQLILDASTSRNLEIFRSSSGLREGSLLETIDRTLTPMGARLLETYLSTPTLDIAEIKRRQNMVWDFYAADNYSEISSYLKNIRDIPRILGRLENRLRSPRELGALLFTISQIAPLKECLRNSFANSIRDFAEKLDDFSDLKDFMQEALADELPAKIQDGGVVREGFDAELDELRMMSKDSKTWLANLEAQEQAQTGIRNLRIKYSGSFGYFIEITKSNLDNVPPHYIRRQTMTNAERYTTEELRKKEKEILNSEVASLEREDFLFNEIVGEVLAHAKELARASKIIAEIDLFKGWAELARDCDYCRPEVNDTDLIDIVEGRHPVVEQTLEKHGASNARGFVPNDVHLSSSTNQIALITGPNMAGKSTYIRQVALIVYMAQIGSFVPAKSCKIGIVDRIFSRVGASDELAKGNSTFMVEMNETANILNNSTAKSLLILDEIGRGTSTYDGLSIAWAVVEYLHGLGNVGPKTLFATHYHELTKLEETLERLMNYRVAVKEWNDEIIFIRKIERGAADKSYGIQVARLAGLPQEVIERAKEVLSELETEGNLVKDHLQASVKKSAERKRPSSDWDTRQMSFL